MCSRRLSFDSSSTVAEKPIDDAILPYGRNNPSNRRAKDGYSRLRINLISEIMSFEESPRGKYVSFLTNALENEDYAVRRIYIHKLKWIALSLGERHTRDILIPFLAKLSNMPEDMCETLVRELQEFPGLVGGPEHQHCLLPLMAKLSINDNNWVQQQAVTQIDVITKDFSVKDTECHLKPLIEYMCNANFHKVREAASCIIAISYPLSDIFYKHELLRLFRKLCEDLNPFVRHAAALKLTGFISDISPDDIVTDVVPMLDKLAEDDLAQIKLQAAMASMFLSDDYPQVSASLFARGACNTFKLRERFTSLFEC